MAPMQMCAKGFASTHAHTCAHGCTHVRVHARMHARMHARAHTRTHTRMHARTHASTHACTRARTHARTHAQSRTHAHKRTQTHATTHSARTQTHTAGRACTRLRATCMHMRHAPAIKTALKKSSHACACACACMQFTYYIYMRAFLHARRAEISAVAPAARHRCSSERLCSLRCGHRQKEQPRCPKKVKTQPASDVACAGLGRLGFERSVICGFHDPGRLPGRANDPRPRMHGWANAEFYPDPGHVPATLDRTKTTHRNRVPGGAFQAGRAGPPGVPEFFWDPGRCFYAPQCPGKVRRW